MRLVFLTPGTGNFHCGSCLRDHDLVRALRKRGHDAVMAPLYLPHVLDHPAGDDGRQPVLLGGINAYLQHTFGLFRRTPRWFDRLFDAPALLQLAARRSGMTSARALGELTLAMLRGESGTQKKEVAKLADWLRHQHHSAPIDAVVLSNALLLGGARSIAEAVGAPVVCTLQGEDTFLDALPEPYRQQCWTTLRERTSDVCKLIAVSQYHADIMRARLALPGHAIAVVHNGIDLTGYVESGSQPRARAVGYLARLCPAKGLAVLVDAFIHLRRDPVAADVRLIAAGAMTPSDRAFVREQQHKLTEAGLREDAEFLPNIDRADKLAMLSRIAVLSVPATYGESFGLYVLEALAAGVPVVQPRHGAFPEILGMTGGGVLVEPDDAEALASAWSGLLRDPDAAVALGREGRRRVFDGFSADAMAARFESVLQALESPSIPSPRTLAGTVK